MAIGFLVMQHCCRTHAYETEYPNAQGYILEIQGALIGHLLLESSTELEIRLVYLAILTPWRGRGIGSAVIEALKCIASDRAVPLCLSVNRDNRASSLYAAHGFVEIDRGGVYINMAWKAPEYDG